MKKLKRFTALLSLTLAFVMFIPQMSVIPNNTIEANAATVKLNKKKATLYKGKTLQLKVTGTKKKVTWKSSNRKVATVSTKGKVAAKKKGIATITAKVKKKKFTCKITVKDKVSSFSYSANGYTLKYLSYELGENSSGEKCIITYWNFTNKSGELNTPSSALVLRAFQKDIELTPYSSYDGKYPEIDTCNYRNVKKGKTVKIAYMHKLKNNSAVEFEIVPQYYNDNTKFGEMKINIK